MDGALAWAGLLGDERTAATRPLLCHPERALSSRVLDFKSCFAPSFALQLKMMPQP